MMAQSNSACLANPTTTSGDHFHLTFVICPVNEGICVRPFGVCHSSVVDFIEGHSHPRHKRNSRCHTFSIWSLTQRESAVVEQQFEVARQILDAGLVPIIEPEVDIYSEKKMKETILKKIVESIPYTKTIMLC